MCRNTESALFTFTYLLFYHRLELKVWFNSKPPPLSGCLDPCQLLSRTSSGTFLTFPLIRLNTAAEVRRAGLQPSPWAADSSPHLLHYSHRHQITSICLFITFSKTFWPLSLTNGLIDCYNNFQIKISFVLFSRPYLHWFFIIIHNIFKF